MKFRRAVPMLGLMSAAAASAAPAQVATGACSIDQNKPGSVQKATLALVRLQGTTAPGARAQVLSEVVKALSAEKSTANVAGQNYMLAQALTSWAAEPNMGGVVKRGTLGYATDPEGTIDVLMAADSALNRVTEAAPACAATIAQMRQNQAWLNQVNAAITALNAGKADSAEYYANRSLIMYQGSPYAWHVLSAVAQNKNDDANAMKYWGKVVEVAGADTSYRDIRNSAMFNMAVTKAQAAEAATGDAQKTAARDAAAALQAFIAAAPGSPDAARAQPTLARMLLLTGDRAALKSTYAEQLATPDKFNDLALTQGGVIASQANDTAAAAKLFEAALAQNPYSRDALNNVSATYLQLKQYDKIIPVARRLVTIDPSNPDNFAFLSLAYNGLANAAAAGSAQKKAFNDSAFKYYQISEQMPVKVTFNEFTRGETRSIVGVQVEGVEAQAPATPAAKTPARAGAKPAAPAAKPAAGPKTYTMKLEFLDKNGNVVDTQEQTVGPISAGERKTVKFESSKPGIAAFRYAPLS